MINSGPGTPPTTGLDVCGDLLFSVGGNGTWLRIIDINNLGSISTIGNYYALTGPYDVCVSGDHAYVADPYGTDLTIIDISAPNMPVLAGSYEWGQFVRSITVAGNHAYLAGDTGGLLIADVSDPTNPLPVGQYDTVDRAMHVVVDGDYAFVANEYSGILVLDISDPTDPVYVDHRDTPGIASGVARHGDLLLLANGDQGVFVFRAFTTGFDVVANTAQSRIIDNTDEIIRLVGVTMERTGDVSIELSADGGTNWEAVPVTHASAVQSVSMMPTWYFLANPGPDLLWRTVHHYAHDGVNPSISSLRIDYSSETATFLQSFSAKAVDGGVLIEWELSQLDEGVEFLISRTDEAVGTVVTIDPGAIEREDLKFRYLDASAEPGKIYRYCIEYEDETVQYTLFETGPIEMPELLLTLFQNSPNPFNPSRR